jgi:hypothetical protein
LREGSIWVEEGWAGRIRLHARADARDARRLGTVVIQVLVSRKAREEQSRIDAEESATPGVMGSGDAIPMAVVFACVEDAMGEQGDEVAMEKKAGRMA